MAYNKVETTNITGRCFDFISSSAIENGSLIAMGGLATIPDSGEGADAKKFDKVYEATVPAVGDEVFLVAQPAWDYTNSPSKNVEEAFIIPANTVFRAYEMNHNDKYAVQKYGISNNTNLAVGDYITVDGTTVVQTDAGTTAPAATYGFVGQVEYLDDTESVINPATGAIQTSTKVIVKVIQNKNVPTE